MSIEKNDSNFLKHSGLSFTTIINQTMNKIKDPAALGIYCYLASKPNDWKICYVHLQKHFDVGRDFITKRMKYLSDIGLIKKVSIRDENGKIIKWETHLLNFTDHNTENTYCGEKDKPTILKTHNVEKQECGKTDTTNKRIKQNKEKITKELFFQKTIPKNLHGYMPAKSAPYESPLKQEWLLSKGLNYG